MNACTDADLNEWINLLKDTPKGKDLSPEFLKAWAFEVCMAYQTLHCLQSNINEKNSKKRL